MRLPPPVNWSALGAAVETALRQSGRYPPSTRITDRLRFLDAGLNHDNFVFEVCAAEPLRAQADGLILRRVKHAPADEATAVARLHVEAQTLRALGALPCDFDTPQFICFVEDPDGVARALVETAVVGWPLAALNKGDEHSRAAIATIGRVAAAVHRLPVAAFPFLPSHADADAHLAASLARHAADFLACDADAAAAHTWIQAHRSAGRPATVLHSDLLPQNVLATAESPRPGLIDWEYAQRGDPAYDLAIVTRGNRKLLGVQGGPRQLLDAYHAAGGGPMKPADVRAWELLFVLRWLHDAIQAARAGQYGGQPPEYYRHQLRALLRRGAR